MFQSHPPSCCEYAHSSVAPSLPTAGAGRSATICPARPRLAGCGPPPSGSTPALRAMRAATPAGARVRPPHDNKQRHQVALPVAPLPRRGEPEKHNQTSGNEREEGPIPACQRNQHQEEGRQQSPAQPPTVERTEQKKQEKGNPLQRDPLKLSFPELEQMEGTEGVDCPGQHRRPTMANQRTGQKIGPVASEHKTKQNSRIVGSKRPPQPLHRQGEQPIGHVQRLEVEGGSIGVKKQRGKKGVLPRGESVTHPPDPPHILPPVNRGSPVASNGPIEHRQHGRKEIERDRGIEGEHRERVSPRPVSEP